MTKAQQDNATQSDVAGVMGLNNLIEHRVSSDPPKHVNQSSFQFQ